MLRVLLLVYGVVQGFQVESRLLASLIDNTDATTRCWFLIWISLSDLWPELQTTLLWHYRPCYSSSMYSRFQHSCPLNEVIGGWLLKYPPNYSGFSYDSVTFTLLLPLLFYLWPEVTSVCAETTSILECATTSCNHALEGKEPSRGRQ